MASIPGRNIVYGTAAPALEVVGAHRLHRKSNVSLASYTKQFSTPVDTSWLPLAAEAMHLSSNLDDYLLVDVPIVTVDVPNRNMEAFPFSEVASYDPVLQGKPIYQTFVGKPTFFDHNNQDPTKAKGVIFRAALQFAPKYGVWKIRILKGFDRTKDPQLVKSISKGELSSYSMGAYVNEFVCSICGREERQGANGRCQHMTQRGSIWGGKLAYRLSSGVVYFESSAVGEPADPTAYGELLSK